MEPIGKPARIVVLGCSGAGKSTLAARIAERFDLPYVATDSVYWRKDWVPAPRSDISAWLDAATAAPQWVLDGNFDAQRDILWGRAQLAIWLDLPWLTTISRVLCRNLGWWIGRKKIWGGQRMTLSTLISGVRHAAQSHGVKRRTYPDLLSAFPNLAVVRIRSARELEKWFILAVSCRYQDQSFANDGGSTGKRRCRD